MTQYKQKESNIDFYLSLTIIKTNYYLPSPDIVTYKYEVNVNDVENFSYNFFESLFSQLLGFFLYLKEKVC